MNMAGPIGGTFIMEAVEPRERATTSGLMTMADNVLRASTAILAGQMMSSGDYILPYHFTSALYLTASTLYFVFFRKMEKPKVERTARA